MLRYGSGNAGSVLRENGLLPQIGPQIKLLAAAVPNSGVSRADVDHPARKNFREPKHLVHALGDLAESLFAFAQDGEHMCAFRSLGCFVDGAPHRFGQSFEPVLQHIIGSAYLEALDSAIFTNGSGNKYERYFRPLFSGTGQCG